MGAITASSVVSLGSGYSAGVVLFVVQGANQTAYLQILTVDGSGVPLTYVLPEQSFADSNVGISNRGCGYSPASNLPTAYASGPVGGVGFVVNILTVGPGTDATHGPIDELQIADGGAGYVTGDTGTIVQGGNVSGAYTVNASGGVVIDPVAFDPADGYAVGPATTVNGGPQPGIGAGLTLDILSILQCAFAGCDIVVTPGPANPGDVVPLPDARGGQPYHAQISSHDVGGPPVQNFKYTLVFGALPPGMFLVSRGNGVTADIYGTPDHPAFTGQTTYTFGIKTELV